MVLITRAVVDTSLFKRLAYMLTAYCNGSKICEATGCFIKALPMGQNIVLDKSYTKQLGQISILEHTYMYIVLRVPYTCNFIGIDSIIVKYQLSRQSNIKNANRFAVLTVL